MTSPRAARGSRRPTSASAKARKPPEEEGVPRRLQIRRGVAFAGAAALPTWLALHGGGYDLGIRQQTALVVWWVIAAGFALGALPRVRLASSLLVPGIALAGLVCWTLLSLTWTESSERT